MRTPLRTALALAFLASPLAAARVEIVLDVSGSMRASAGPMSRMEAAQRPIVGVTLLVLRRRRVAA